MEQNIFIFFEGQVNWWAAYKRPRICKIRYSDLISDFLKKLEIKFKISLTPDDVYIYFFIESTSEKVRVMDLNTNIPESHNHSFEIVVKALESTKEPTRADVPAEKALNFIKMGNLFYEKNDFVNALLFYDAADHYGILDYAKIFYKNKKWELLQAILPLLFKYFPTNIDVIIMQCKYLEHTGNYSQALNFYIRALQFSDRSEINLGTARVYMKMNEFLRADLRIKKALAANDYDPKTLKEFCKLKIAIGDYHSAITIALRHPQTYKMLGKAVIDDESFNTLVSLIFNPINTENPTFFNSKAISDIGKILYKNGQTKYACKFLQDALNVNAGVEIFYQLFKIFFLERDRANFSNVLKQFIAIYSGEVFPGLSSGDLVHATNPEHRLISLFPPPNVNSLRPELLPFLKIWMLMTCYAYSFGMYLHSYEIRNKFNNFLEFLKPPLVHGNLFFLFQASNHAPPLTPKQGLRKLIFLGDENMFYTGPMTIGIDNDLINVEHVPYCGLSLFSMQNKETVQKKKFLEQLDNYLDVDVVLCFGTIDCQKEIPKLIQKMVFKKPFDAIKSIVDNYIKFLNTLIPKKKQNIFIHPAFPLKEDSARIVGVFNAYLKENLPKDFVFLRIFDEKVGIPKVLIPENRMSNGEYHFNLRKEIENRISNVKHDHALL